MSTDSEQKVLTTGPVVGLSMPGGDLGVSLHSPMKYRLLIPDDLRPGYILRKLRRFDDPQVLGPAEYACWNTENLCFDWTQDPAKAFRCSRKIDAEMFDALSPDMAPVTVCQYLPEGFRTSMTMPMEEIDPPELGR